MDIKQFEVAETSRLHLRDSNDELMYADGDKSRPVMVTLYGPGSRQYAVASSKQNSRMLDRLKKKGKAELSADQKTQEGARFLADCTSGFENLEYDGLTGDELAMAVYSNQRLGFIADQISAFIGNWSNFSMPSTKG